MEQVAFTATTMLHGEKSVGENESKNVVLKSLPTDCEVSLSGIVDEKSCVGQSHVKVHFPMSSCSERGCVWFL